MRRLTTLALCAGLAMPVLADGARLVDDAAIADASNTSDWLAYGRTHSEQRFSPLQDINTETVADLGVAWFRDLPDGVGLVSTPLVVDGVLFFVGTMNVVRAVDARTGADVWTFDPEVAKEVAGKKLAGWVHNRGLSAYGDKILTATWDGRLIALDRLTGKEVWSTRTFGLDEARYITGHPKAFQGMVVIGNGGTETGPSRGYVTAYDVETGKQLWRFYVVPGNPADGFEDEAMKMAAETWTGKWWEHGGGGNVWHGLTYDDELDVLYIGTGNGSPWNRKIRSPEGGDNLFLCSIVALDPDTGAYLWHYQTTPGESWDYNSNMDIVLADLEIDGRDVKAILHAPKNGFFYVIDREKGELISAEPFTDVNWATHVDRKTGKPVEVPNARYPDGTFTITPSLFGGHSWHAMSFNPQTGLVYLPTLHISMDMDDRKYDESWRSVAFEGGSGVDWVEGQKPREYDGSLQAWDPVQQEQVWSIPQVLPWGTGTLATAGGVVFQGEANGRFNVYDATDGEHLWQYDAGLGISAPPITYELDGEQYIALLVGYGGGYAGGLLPDASHIGWAYGAQTRRVVAFKLGGEVEVPKQPPPVTAEPLFEADFAVDAELAVEGEQLWITRACYGCHGGGAIAAGMAPDLRASAMPFSEMAPFFAQVVRDGERMPRGMPGFPDITDKELDALRHYIRREAHAALASDAPKTN